MLNIFSSSQPFKSNFKYDETVRVVSPTRSRVAELQYVRIWTEGISQSELHSGFSIFLLVTH